MSVAGSSHFEKSVQCNFILDSRLNSKNKSIQTLKERGKGAKNNSKPTEAVAAPNQQGAIQKRDVAIQCEPKRERDVQTQTRLTQRRDAMTEANVHACFKDSSTQCANKNSRPEFEENSFLKLAAEQCATFLDVKPYTTKVGLSSILVTDPKLFGLPGENIMPIEISIEETGKCSVIIIFREIEHVHIDLDCSQVEIIERIKSILSNFDDSYVYCPGIKPDLKEYLLGYNESIEVIKYPIERCQSSSCRVWYQKCKKRYDSSQCNNCKQSAKNLQKIKKRRNEESPDCSEKRMRFNSNYSSDKLTPSENRERQKKVRAAMKLLQQRLKRYEKKSQHDEIIDTDIKTEICESE